MEGRKEDPAPALITEPCQDYPCYDTSMILVNAIPGSCDERCDRHIESECATVVGQPLREENKEVF